MTPITPRPLEWIDTAPVRAARSRRIAQPPAVVWAAIADHAGWTQWFPRLAAVTPGEVADAVGGTRTVDLGVVAVEEEFLAWEPERHFAFTVVSSTKGGVRSMVEDIRLTRDGDRACTVTYTMAVEPVGARLLRPILEPVLRKAIGDGLAGLAAHVRG
ncbi:MAG: SRPBCC family protein [Acidimicrobiia bacterium]